MSAISRCRDAAAVPFGVMAIGCAGITKALWETALFVGSDSLTTEDNS